MSGDSYMSLPLSQYEWIKEFPLTFVDIINDDIYTKEEFIKLTYNDIFRHDYRYRSIIKSKLIKCICDSKKVYLLAGGRSQSKRLYANLIDLEEYERIRSEVIKLIEEN